MQNDTVKSAVVIALLLLSILSAVYLALHGRFNKNYIPVPTGVSSVSNISVGLVEICGPIYAPYEEAGLFKGAGLSEIIKILSDFRKDKNIKGVILRINSPGGTIGAVQEISAEVRRIKNSGKPVIASISDVGASGGYYIASVCSKIIANPGTIIGSIGVIMMSTDISELMDKLGVRMEIIKSGSYKDMGSFHRPYSSEERNMLHNMLKDTHRQFIETVSEGRNIPIEKVEKMAKGQVYSGNQALELKLIDKLGDLQVAIDVIEKATGLKNVQIVQKSFSKWHRVFKLIEGRFNITGIIKKRFSGPGYYYDSRRIIYD
ncbi:signal peptide peptidase SppA [Elusimicrobiota bacterium]